MTKDQIILKLMLCAACLPVWCNGQTLSPRTFRVTTDASGKYWFVGPKGDRFLSLGVNNIIDEPFRPKPNTRYYAPVINQFNGDFDAWKQDVFKILRGHGFNTLGCWSDGRLYGGSLYGTICLYVAGHAEDRCLDGLRPGFEDRVREHVRLALERYPHLDNVLGVFLDNEMPWYGHAPWGDISNYTLLEAALSLPADDAGRQAAVDFLKKRYESVEKLSAAWGQPLASWGALTVAYARSCVNPQTQADRAAFIEHAADAFFETSSRVVRQMLPGKLILGTRFAGYAPEPVVRACGRTCDVISFNDYRSEPSPDIDMLARFWIWGGQKPLMVTEYAWRAEENTSGNKNSRGGGAVVKTQAERAEKYQRYIEDLLSYPMVIGAHWFEFADQSPDGRFDGEDSNYGIVDIHHRPYSELLAAMKETNERVKTLHADSDRRSPESLPETKPVRFEPGQRPDRPASIDLLVIPPTRQPELFCAPDARISLDKNPDAWVLNLNTGNQWGGGAIFFGPEKFRNPSGPAHSTDLSGYSAIELDAVIEKGATFSLFLDEAGVDSPTAVSYDTSAGDDGEGFLISGIQGRQERFLYRFELKNLQPRKDWGNQKGLRKVDIQAIKGVAIFLHGGQGETAIRIYSLRLVR